MKQILLAAFFAAFVGQVVAQETSVLTIVSEDASYEFSVEIADEPSEIQTGLMFREALADEAGMLFDFGTPREANMWMKNVTLSLDMLFLEPDGTVIAIAERAVPGSERRINPGVPVKGVLELIGGRAAELGLKPGDKVVHPIFQTVDEG